MAKSVDQWQFQLENIAKRIGSRNQQIDALSDEVVDLKSKFEQFYFEEDAATTSNESLEAEIEELKKENEHLKIRNKRQFRVIQSFMEKIRAIEELTYLDDLYE